MNTSNRKTTSSKQRIAQKPFFWSLAPISTTSIECKEANAVFGDTVVQETDNVKKL